jgi:hypothetical protein
MVFSGLHARTPPRDGDSLAAHARARVVPLAVLVVTFEDGRIASPIPIFGDAGSDRMRPDEFDRRPHEASTA